MSLAVVRDTTLPSRPRRRQDVRQAIEGLRRRHPRASGDRLAQALVDALLDDRDLLLDVARFVIEKIAAAAEARQRQSRAAPTPRQRASRRASEKTIVKQLAQKARERIWLDLPIVLLSGETKPLRYVLGRELAELGGIYQAVAVKVGLENLVGEVLLEAELKTLLQAVV
jgi:hypothetical protein